jgi:hypothetical protein
MWKIATSAAAIGLSLCLATAAAEARGGGGTGGGGGGGGGHFGGGGGGGGGGHFGGGGGGGAHFGGGGGGHFGGGGGARFGGGGGGAHFTGHAAPHFSGRAAPHYSGRVGGGGGGRNFASHSSRFASHSSRFASHTSHVGRGSFHASGHGSGNRSGNALNTRGSRLSRGGTPASAHAAMAGARFAHTNPGSFAAHRQFANAGAFHHFWGHGWHWHNHLGWVGPLFWPLAYGNFFYYALWPDDYAYVDPFWVYGYGDIYEGIFSPYAYDDYVRGPGAPARMTALTEGMAQSCTDEAAEVTGWPIDQINAALQPNQQQGALLDDLGNAVVKASDVIKSHCPTTVSFTPTGRIDTMQQRLQGLVQAADIVSVPLNKFYDALSDEQKARFNSIKPPADNEGAPNTKAGNANVANPKTECNASVMAWPNEQIDRAVQPNDAQRAKLQALQSAAANGADVIKAACPAETPGTPPARFAAVGKHLQAMLQAVEAIRPPLHDFYNSLSDNQKARFNTMGKQLFAQTQQ